jgi:hypothetical protein
VDMEPVKMNKCITDFTVNSQTGPSMRNSKKWFGKQLQLNKERKGSPDPTLIDVSRKVIKNFDEAPSKPVLKDTLIRGILFVDNKSKNKKPLNKSSSKNRG